jgi:hypothetical protein
VTTGIGGFIPSKGLSSCSAGLTTAPIPTQGQRA